MNNKRYVITAMGIICFISIAVYLLYTSNETYHKEVNAQLFILNGKGFTTYKGSDAGSMHVYLKSYDEFVGTAQKFNVTTVIYDDNQQGALDLYFLYNGITFQYRMPL